MSPSPLSRAATTACRASPTSPDWRRPWMAWFRGWREDERQPIPVLCAAMRSRHRLRAAADVSGRGAGARGGEPLLQPRRPAGPERRECIRARAGVLGGHAASACSGHVYNDTADGKFKFTVADDGTVNGNAHIRMSHAPQTMPGDCVFTRTQDPEEFDVSIDGRRNGDL